jgi:hypothetical protein
MRGDQWPVTGVIELSGDDQMVEGICLRGETGNSRR